MSPTRSFLFGAALLAMGCSAEANFALEAAVPGSSGDPNSIGLDDTGTSPTPPSTDQLVPTEYALDGFIEIVAGAVDPLLSSVAVTLYDDDGAVVCADALLVDGVTDADPTTLEVTVLGWWDLLLLSDGSLQATDPEGACTAEDPVPTSLRLGIGPYDPLLDAATAAFELPAPFMYGLYLEPDLAPAPLWVFGVAGTSEQFAETTPPVSAAPLPDGTYRLVGLHLLPLP